MPTERFKSRVLVVDDEPIILQTMSAILEGEGFAVRVADDGFAGLKTLREMPPDIIISDLRMPNMSGFEFLAIVRRRFPQIPVIAISGEYVVEGRIVSFWRGVSRRALKMRFATVKRKPLDT